MHQMFQNYILQIMDHKKNKLNLKHFLLYQQLLLQLIYFIYNITYDNNQ